MLTHHMIQIIDVHQKMIGMEDHVIPKDVVVALIHHMVAGEAMEAAQHHVVEEFNIDIELIQIIQTIMDKIVEVGSNLKVEVVIHNLVLVLFTVERVVVQFIGQQTGMLYTEYILAILQQEQLVH